MKGSQIEFQDRRVRLVEQMLKIDQEALLEVVEKLLGSVSQNQTADALTKAQIQTRLDNALQDAKTGRTIDTDDLISEIDNWG